MRLLFLIAAVVLLVAPADARTRPVNCPATHVRMPEPPRPLVELRVKSWSTAPDVHRNVPCRNLNRTARRVTRDVTGESWRYGWILEWRRGNVTAYYGGHGLEIRVRTRELDG